MDNATLTKRAKELEFDLSGKIKCYLVVGWLRGDSYGDVFMVYIDKRARISSKLIPDTWYGLPVATQDVLPPGVNPDA